MKELLELKKIAELSISIIESNIIKSDDKIDISCYRIGLKTHYMYLKHINRLINNK